MTPAERIRRRFDRLCLRALILAGAALEGACLVSLVLLIWALAVGGEPA
jgi:hypothetical protein